MKLDMFFVDSFSDKLFRGNPAAVCALSDWLEDGLMQAIANENNLSETAFFVPYKDGYKIRWFTPLKEVALCGHATLATAFVLYNQLGINSENIKFYSQSGLLTVYKNELGLELDFPAKTMEEFQLQPEFIDCFGITPIACYKADDYHFVYASEEEILKALPNFDLIKNLPARGISISAKGETFDFVNRFFAPRSGINEDPVTGSAYTYLIPFWSKKLSKHKLSANQLSRRAGIVRGEYLGERVRIGGQAILYMHGKIEI